jgi:hypothetical protein
METETGWWLIRHPDHARLAGAFAAAWGNEQFRKPEPRERVLFGIATHDDGWVERDAHPTITRQGKPSAFSSELVGKYAAFEEIDIAEYLSVRDRAVRIIADKDPYAGLLFSMHTFSLLTEHCSTIAADGIENKHNDIFDSSGAPVPSAGVLGSTIYGNERQIQFALKAIW